MESAKLKLDRFSNIQVIGCPDEIKLGIKSSQKDIDCVFSFVITKEQMLEAIDTVKKTKRSITLILAYPKGTSKKYQAEINRDSIIEKIKAEGTFKAPKLMSLDQDWSIFSFRY